MSGGYILRDICAWRRETTKMDKNLKLSYDEWLKEVQKLDLKKGKLLEILVSLFKQFQGENASTMKAETLSFFQCYVLRETVVSNIWRYSVNILFAT